MQLQPKSNERLVSEIVRKVRNKYTRTGLNQADQLDTLWNDLGRTPDWVIGCFEESIKEALTLKDQAHKTEMEEAVAKERGEEAKFWFETWYSHYIAPETPAAGEFGQFAVTRIQETAYHRDTLTTPLPESDKSE